MRLLALPLVALTLANALAETMDEKFAALPPGAAMVGERGIEEFKFSGSGGKAKAVVVDGQSFERAMRVTTAVKPDVNYKVRISAKTIAPIKKGDRLLASFWARGIAPLPAEGEARAQFCFEQAGDPYEKSAMWTFTVGAEWRRFFVPFEAKGGLDAGGARVEFRTGYDPQTIEIGGVQVINFGTQLERSALPYTPLSYVGRDAGAAWRKAAAERIEKIRKAELTVVVVDADGKPLPGARVAVRMKRHAFAFGSAVNGRLLLAPGPDADRYREIVARDFNKVTIENQMKWHEWERDRDTATRAVAWLRERGIPVRGHCLVWPAAKNLPKSVTALFSQPDALRRTVLDHIADEAGAFADQCVEWDVMNEPYSNFDIQNILAGRGERAPRLDAEAGAEFIAEWFKAARAADPHARLDINDYSILSTGGTDAAHQEYYERTIRRLLELGAPVGGIGMQSHFGEDLTPIPRLIEILDRFGKFGLPIQATEHDVNTWDEALQADYTRDYMTALFSHAAVGGIITWGFWEGSHWIPNAAYYRKDWSLRPAGEVWRDLVFRQWWTNAEGQSGEGGVFTTRGFLGEYEIEAEHARQKQTVKATLPAAGARVEVRLPAR